MLAGRNLRFHVAWRLPICPHVSSPGKSYVETSHSLHSPPAPPAASRQAMFGPVLFGASSFACADVLSKVTFRAGGDPLTVSTLRGVIGLAVLFVWIRLARLPRFIARREKTIALGLGIVF